MNILSFLKTTWLILFTFGIMQFGGKGNKFCPIWALGAGQNGQNLTIIQNSSSLLPHIWKKNWIHSYTDRKALYQIVNFMSSGVGGSALERGQNNHIVLIHIMIKKLLNCCWYWIETDCIIRKTIKPSTHIVHFMSLR